MFETQKIEHPDIERLLKVIGGFRVSDFIGIKDRALYRVLAYISSHRQRPVREKLFHTKNEK